MRQFAWTCVTVLGVLGVLGVPTARTARSAEPTVMQFRGPNGVGVFTGQPHLPTRWSATEGIRWKAELPGRGLSQPVFAGDTVLLTACTGRAGEVLHVLALDRTDGRTLWQRRITATGLTGCHPKTNMAAPTPVTDGQRVYALFATCDLMCLDLAGNLLWYRALAQDYPKLSNQVGMASSPILAGGVLVVSMETGAESWLAGLDPATGVNRWKVDRNRDINWTTPITLTVGTGNAARIAIVMQSRSDLTAYDAADGRTLWSFIGDKLSAITSPVLAEDAGLVLVPGSQLLALKLTPDSNGPSLAWQSAKLRPGTSSPLAADGRVYTVNNAGVLSAARVADGEVVWQKRLQGPFSASPMLADGKIYAVNEEGTTFVLSAETGEILGRNPLGEVILASPVAADGAIFLRSDKYLYCLGSPK